MNWHGEPWTTRNTLVFDVYDRPVCGAGVEPRDNVNLTRIVACVNACEGIPTNDLTNPSHTVCLTKMSDDGPSNVEGMAEIFALWCRKHYAAAALELLDLYFGPSQGIFDRKEAFLLKHGWEKRTAHLGCITIAGEATEPLAYEYVKGERVMFLAGALAEEVTEQFKALKGEAVATP